VTDIEIREVDAGGTRISVREWGRRDAPPLVLIAGTGLAGAIFADCERLLANDWHGYTVDPRGQGRSAKPSHGYEFADFAADLRSVAVALGLQGASGIGHSAGGTDLLLAAASDPARWAKLVVIEPTIQDPRRPALPETDPPGWAESYARALRRRPGFPSLDVASERFRTNPWFARCDPGRPRAYLAEALEPAEDGSWLLRCPPPIEGEMNRYIVQAMQHRYPRGEVFAPLLGLPHATCIVTMGESGEMYAAMARLALEVIPRAEHHHLPGFGHLLPLESPEATARLAGWLRDRR